MTRTPSTARQMGFTLIEMLTAMGIFLLICGAAFTLLGTSQQRYRTESQVLNSFQEARLGLDQIVSSAGLQRQRFRLLCKFSFRLEHRLRLPEHSLSNRRRWRRDVHDRHAGRYCAGR